MLSVCRAVRLANPVSVTIAVVGTYTFRMHADYGLGAYVGVDGAAFTDSTWGHVELDPVSLSAGEHEFESLVRPQPRSRRACAAQFCLTPRPVPGLRGLL